jgi:hypothetical protein
LDLFTRHFDTARAAAGNRCGLRLAPKDNGSVNEAIYPSPRSTLETIRAQRVWINEGNSDDRS